MCVPPETKPKSCHNKNCTNILKTFTNSCWKTWKHDLLWCRVLEQRLLMMWHPEVQQHQSRLEWPIAKKLSSVAGRQTRMRFVYCLRGYAGVPRAGARVPPAARLTARRPSDCRSRPALFFSYVLQYTVVVYYRIAVAWKMAVKKPKTCLIPWPTVGPNDKNLPENKF